MDEKERLESEIKLLESFEYTHAWTGSLNNLRQKSYILYSDIIKAVDERKRKLKRLNRNGI